MPTHRFLSTLLAVFASTPFMLAVPADAHAQPAPAPSPVREVRVEVDRGYHPQRVEVAAGERVRLVFVRRDYGPCTREVVFPALGLRRALPTGEAVALDLPPLAAGEYAFHCGMNMVRGTLVAR